MRKLVRIPKDADLPLIGCITFGLIDRGTNLIQVRPISGCCLNCIFCSVDEGPKSKTRVTSYMVDVSYLIEWLREIIKFKGEYKIECHLDCCGEVTLYPHLVDLVQAISEIKGVDTISMQTKALLLDEKKIDELAEVGLSRINLSIDSLDPELAKKITGTESYDVNRIIRLAKYIVKTKIDLLLAPVWIPELNDEEIPKIIEFAKEIGCGKKWFPLGIQNYEVHKFGRKVKGVKPISYWKFFRKLEELEKKFNVKLRVTPKDFGIHKRKMIPLAFKKGEKTRVVIKAPGWMRNEMIGVAKNRCITVVNCSSSVEDEIRVKILENKHNLYIAKKV